MDQTSGASVIRTPHMMSEVEATMEKTVATGAWAEAIAGAAALILAVLGLAGIFPAIMSAIAVIAAGAAFLAVSVNTVEIRSTDSLAYSGLSFFVS